MKKLLLFVILFLTIALRAQEGKPVVYTEVVKVDSTKNAKQLYASAKMWVTKTYKNPKYVIQLDDTENNTIVGDGTYSFSSKIFMGGAGRSGMVKYSFTIACKNGRYKYTFDNIINEKSGVVTEDEIQKKWDSSWTGNVEFRKKVSKELRDDVNIYFNALISTLKEEMQKPSVNKENW